MRISRFVVALLASLSTFTQASPPLTQRCDAGFSYGEVIVDFNGLGSGEGIAAVVADPSLDPELFRRLWEPKGITLYSNQFRGLLRYDSAQDAAEIVAALRSDVTLAQRGVAMAYANSYAIDFLPPPMPRITVTEYYNRILEHYFLSGSEGENQYIDSGGAGPGWERTGETFLSTPPQSVYGAQRVFRFYNVRANTHFFTAEPAECGLVRRVDPGWAFEGDGFGARSVNANGTCDRGKPIYRLYNNRWMYDDSNHRFVTKPSLYEAMQAKGWIGEGIVMCTMD